MNFQVVAAIILQGQIKPHPTRQEHVMNFFNEVFLLGMVYHLCIFTAWTQSSELKYSSGWSMTAVTAFNIIVNMIVLWHQSIKALIKDCRERKRSKEVEKHLKDRKTLHAIQIAAA